ncbi:ABC transporter substrate-binding protein [Enterococcus sp. DIV0876]|uniref:ABC transporter substrate-binding protein n=1 Tax=Enterococcus sp. DIV0876 TaxID=2774633 RepID=UPI003D2FB2C2
MKRLWVFFGGIVGILSLLFVGTTVLTKESGATSSSDPNTLIIYNWGEYIDPDLIKKFEDESGYSVIYNTFDSNEAMETKVKQGGTRYDLIFPSESIIPKMIEEGLLLPLDHSKLTGTKDLSTFLMDQSFDPDNRYSIPYFWGTIGIMVNTEDIDPTLIKGWSDLWNPAFKNDLLMVDGARETLGLALQVLGDSQNEKDPNKIAAAVEKLNDLRPNVKAVLTDEIKTLMINHDAAIGIGYSGDAAYVMAENPAVEYVVPNDGGAIWTDNFAIPKTVGNKTGAYAFINFMLRPDNAAQNAEYVGYATPSETAKQMLPRELTEDKAFYPDSSAMDLMEHYAYLGKETVEYYNDFFLEWKLGL